MGLVRLGESIIPVGHLLVTHGTDEYLELSADSLSVVYFLTCPREALIVTLLKCSELDVGMRRGCRGRSSIGDTMITRFLDDSFRWIIKSWK